MKIKMMKTILVIAGMLVVNSMAGTLKDSRDGNTYKTVKIGKQTWMAENLNVNVPGSMCYANMLKNCEKYGHLYTWEAAKMACPSGWHLPSKEELESLLAAAGSSQDERSQNLHAGSWENGLDKFGFSALPAGSYRGYGNKKFHSLGDGAYFWSSTEKNRNRAYYLVVGDRGAAGVTYDDEDVGNSVRCLQDSN